MLVVGLGGGWFGPTHSPILAATPGAKIIELGGHGFRHVEWEHLELVDHWRRYLTDPHRYLRYLLTDDERAERPAARRMSGRGWSGTGPGTRRHGRVRTGAPDAGGRGSRLRDRE
jgi:hypothetical protein